MREKLRYWKNEESKYYEEECCPICKEEWMDCQCKEKEVENKENNDKTYS